MGYIAKKFDSYGHEFGELTFDHWKKEKEAEKAFDDRMVQRGREFNKLMFWILFGCFAVVVTGIYLSLHGY